MSSKGPHVLPDVNDLFQAVPMFVPDDPGQVRLVDLENDLRDNRPVTTFLQTNLVSDVSGTAPVTDPNLIDPRGMSSTPASPIWISQNGAGLASLYSVIPPNAANPGETVAPNAARQPVHILAPGGGPSTPTGQVFNPFPAAAGDFRLSYPDGTDAPATFLFATGDGTIAGWNPGLAAAPHTQSVVAVSTPGADYTGLGIDAVGDTPLLYAANFARGTVDVFDANFKKLESISDRHGPPGFAPFNAQVLTVPGVGGAPGAERLFVTFAQQDAVAHGGGDDGGNGGSDDSGNGFVDEFDLQGNLIARIGSDETLNTPWGLAIAPASFGTYAGDLLVGNHGDGTISVFDLNNRGDQSLGHLLDGAGHAITIDDLWGLIPGNGGAGGATGSIYFTAGPQNGTQGLFGSLTPNAAPLQIGMTGSGDH
jgi:uncharacterized protein (TIGR03118 family)